MPQMPKRVKFRKSQRGKVKGNAARGNKVSYGEYGLQSLEGGLEVVDVRLQRRLPLVGDGPGARHTEGGGNAPRAPPGIPLVVLWERQGLARSCPWPRWQRGLARFEAGEPLADVGEEAGFPLLPIADNVHASLDLLAHDLGDGAADSPSVRLLVVGLAVLSGIHHLQQVWRARQAAHKRRQDAVGAALHDGSP